MQGFTDATVQRTDALGLCLVGSNLQTLTNAAANEWVPMVRYGGQGAGLPPASPWLGSEPPRRDCVGPRVGVAYVSAGFPGRPGGGARLP